MGEAKRRLDAKRQLDAARAAEKAARHANAYRMGTEELRRRLADGNGVVGYGLADALDSSGHTAADFTCSDDELGETMHYDLTQAREASRRVAERADALSRWRRRVADANYAWLRVLRRENASAVRFALVTIAWIALLLVVRFAHARDVTTVRTEDGRIGAHVGDTLVDVLGKMGAPPMQLTGVTPTFIYRVGTKTVQVRFGPGGVVSGITESDP